MTISPHLEIQDLLDQALSCRTSDLSRSFKLASEALALSMRTENDSLKARSLTCLALFNMITGKHDESIALSHKALSIFHQLGDEKGVADARYNLAGVYYKTDNYHLGMLVLHECLTTYRKLKDDANCSRVEKSLGTIYEYFGDKTNAIRSYELGIQSALRAGDRNLESNIYNPLSGILLKEGKINEAFEMIEKSISLKKQTGDQRGSAFALYGRGKVHFALQNYSDALKDFLAAFEIHNCFQERLGLGMTYNKLGALYRAMNQEDKAVEVLEEGMNFCDKFNITLFQSKCCLQLSELYELKGDFQKSHQYLKRYQLDRQAMIDAQTKRVIDNYEAITRMKTLELEAEAQREKAEITEKKNRAEEAARIKQEFLSTMSHEIRTPLNGIITTANLLSNRADSEDQKLLDSLRFSGNNLLRIVNDILDFTKMESGKMSLENRNVHLLDCLRLIHGNYIGVAESKGIRLDLNIDTECSRNYHFDDTRLSQVLGNLISNAIKFTDHGGVTVQVETVDSTEDTDTLEFKVIDTGEGIAPKNLEEIFETFAQPRSVATRRQGGTGLGLAIVKHIIKLFQSDIHVKSILEVGTEFSFQLKLQRSVQGISKKVYNVEKLQGMSVLLAEDNPINAIVATKLLSDWGMVIDHVENGHQAIAKANEKKYDFVLMDIHMPEMSGYEATTLIRNQRGPNALTTIFALTADITADNDADFQNCFDGVLTKPIDIEKLKAELTAGCW